MNWQQDQDKASKSESNSVGCIIKRELADETTTNPVRSFPPTVINNNNNLLMISPMKVSGIQPKMPIPFDAPIKTEMSPDELNSAAESADSNEHATPVRSEQSKYIAKPTPTALLSVNVVQQHQPNRFKDVVPTASQTIRLPQIAMSASSVQHARHRPQSAGLSSDMSPNHLQASGRSNTSDIIVSKTRNKRKCNKFPIEAKRRK